MRGEAEIGRGYEIGGGATDVSTGSADLSVYALRARLQYHNLIPSLSPFGEIASASACLGSYTETGGAFPSSFDEVCDDNTEFRVGFDASMPVSDQLTVTGTLEGVHRFDAEGPAISGDVTGLGAFDLGSLETEQDWLRVGLGASFDMGGSTLSVMANSTTGGEATDTWIAATWSISF